MPLYWPVPAIPPKAPQITLLGSSLAPPDNDNDNFDPDSPEGKAAFAELLEQTGLLPSDLRAELQLHRDEPWLGGFGYFPEAHSAAITRSAYDYTTVDNPLTPANLPKVEVVPFDIGTKFTLSALAYQEDFKGRATRQNDVAMHKALEYEFWTGTLAQANSWPNPYLAAGYVGSGGKVTDKTPVPGTPVSITKGLSLLQKAIADTGFGGQAMIHLQPEAAPNLLNTRRVGKLLLDQFDNIIVPGVGDPGTAPDGSTPAAGTSWMYATDMVATRIQKATRIIPDTYAEALDRGQAGLPNTVTFRAKRLGAAYFDGSLLCAVLISLPS